MEPKQRILEKAHELFHRYGLRSVSMDDIAAQVGMSKKTLYLYFTDKDELVDAVFTGIMEINKTQCSVEQQGADNALHEVFLAFDRTQEMFAHMNPAVLFDMEKYHATTFSKFKEFKNNFLYGMIKANIERGIAEELYREDIDIDILTRYRINSIMLAFNPEVFPTNRTQLVRIEQQLVEHFLYGLSTSKGIKLIQKYKSQRTQNRQ
ncbi:MAG TPA: TetR/AcrR family transcriptional regulator [Flavisolibacter sp.]|jgi:AcrR family transcriptional regulator|nr:TetR/AcrR family transcriptional regulator [Flavisolibacter sp.]